MQNRSGSAIGADVTKDCRFKGYVEVGAAVVLIVWNQLLQYGLLPEGDMIMHVCRRCISRRLTQNKMLEVLQLKVEGGPLM